MDLGRRRFLKLVGSATGLVSVCLLSPVPYVQAANASTIPKLSYAPTIDQLYSDFSLQQQMLAVNLKLSSSSPTAGMAGIGFDHNNLNCILAHTTQTQNNISEVGEIAIDAKPIAPASNKGYDTDDFIVLYAWDATDDTKKVIFKTGQSDGTMKTEKLPDGFNSDVRFTKSYFNQTQDHLVFAAQIPNSYMGPGSNGNYGLDLSISPYAVLQGNMVSAIGYPYDSADFIPASWGVFNTAYPIPELRFPQVISAAGIALPLVLLTLRKRRLDAKKRLS